MKLSNFDIFVNKILKESLMSGGVSSTSYKPAEPQKEVKKTPVIQTKDGETSTQQVQAVQQPEQKEQEQQQEAPPEDSSESQATQEDILSQMQDDSKKRDEFEKKFIAALTNMARSGQQTTPQVQQTTPQQSQPINAKQMFGANISI